MRVLRDIGDSRSPVRTLSGFVRWMARNARGVPTAQSANCSSGPSVGEESVSTPRNYNEVQTPVYYNEVQDSNGEIASGLSNHAARVGSWSPNQRTPFGFQDNDYSAREIACVIPDMARMAVDSPCGRISSGFLGSQGRVEADAPVPAMASPMSNRVFAETPTRATAPAMANDIVMQVGSPAHCVPAGLHNHINIDNPIQQIISTPTRVSTPSSVRDLTRRIENMAGPSRSPPSPIWATPQLPTANGHFAANALRGTASPQMLELEELGFRKIFMIFSYLSCNKIEDVLSVDYIRSLKFLSMTDFELKIWRAFGHKYIAATDRAKNLDSDPGMTKVYHCNVEIRGDSVVKVFKGPYIENTRTHLQNVVGDDNILVVKFMENSSTTKTDFVTYCQHYHKVAEDGIVLGLRRYHFFLYKDGGKEEKMKEEKKMEKNKKCTSPVRCYFVRTESGWSMDEPYILSGRTISQARGLFMHIQTAPTMAKYMSRFALILSKTITLDIDLSAVCVTQIDDEPCRDAHGTIVFRDGQPLIHTDGTGLISEDLAAKCPPSIYKGNFLRSHDIAANGETLMRSTSSKRHRSLMTEHPLLTQFRLFHNGLAVKGTVLVDKRLPCGTIVIRPSMIKIKTDQKLAGVRSVNSSELVNARNAKKNLCGVQSVNSFEIVSTSNRPKRTLTSRFLIALLHHGQVPEEYFMGLLQNAIEGAENARRDCGDALKIAFGYADLEDSMSARMILSGIPLEEAYLQYRLAWMAQLERKGIKQGKLPIDECYYLMGTTDPTGKLGPNEVCVILENGQLSGDVLVYKHPGLHFGDIHVLKATYIRDLEKRYVGYSKYAILFPTTGPRSLADEMANSDFDGDMYWVSKNPKLLEHFKPSEPWVQQITPKKTQQKGPQDFDESQLERKLFHEFLRTRFTPSHALGTAADSWLVYMDRLLTKNVDDNEKELIKAKMVKLVDHYYLALDAPKTGDKINIEKDLMVKEYPHFMGRSYSYHSSSILGKIYDEADKLVLRQSENVEPIKISLLPCFTEREASPELMELWQKHYEEYLTDSKLLMNVPDKDERNMKFEQLYQKYKQMLYGAAELEETRRDLEDVFSEACVIYQIVYKKAESANDVGKCRFVWIVAGRALCHFYALKNDGDTAICSLPVLRKILRKDRR